MIAQMNYVKNGVLMLSTNEWINKTSTNLYL